MSVFYTADEHLGHSRIIQYVTRPFASLEEMDEAIINRWNDRVSDKDTVYCLGDFTLSGPDAAEAYFRRLNGHVILIPGGHDRHWIGRAMHTVNGHPVVIAPPILRVPDPNMGKIVLCHYPMLSWEQSHYGAWHLHGHSHGTVGVCEASGDANLPPGKMRGMRVDVGVDCWNFYPVASEMLAGVMP